MEWIYGLMNIVTTADEIPVDTDKSEEGAEDDDTEDDDEEDLEDEDAEDDDTEDDDTEDKK